MTDPTLDLRRFLPTSAKEMKLRGWEEADVILFSGDAYVGSPIVRRGCHRPCART